MSAATKVTTPVRCLVTSEVVKHFAGVRARVKNAMKDLPRSVTFAEALKQANAQLQASRK